MADSKRPVCAVVSRICGWAACQKVFTTCPRLRRKYCSDLCAASACASRHTNRYTVAGALAQLQRSRIAKAKVIEPRATADARPAPRNPVANRHVPGSIAYVLLYGGGPSFSFNDHVGGEKVTGGGAYRVGQVGGPNL